MTEIAKQLNTSQATISRYCKKHCLSRKPIWSLVTDDDIIELTKNHSTYEIAKQLNVSSQSIHERQKRLGINRSLTSCINEIADKVRKHHVNTANFEPLTKLGSYWLGVLFADGSVYNSAAENPYRISLGLSVKDKHWLNQYASDIGLSDTYKINEYTNKHGHRSVRVSFSNMHFARILWKYNLDPRTNYKMSVPNIVYENDFIRGFLDGDGSSSIIRGKQTKPHYTISIYVENLPLAESLIKTISSSGIMMNGPYKHKSIWSIRCSHTKAIELGHWIWNDPVRFLDRKRNTWVSAINL